MGKSPGSLQLEFFFDYSCPWAYVAFVRVLETAMRTGAQMVWKPILLERLLKAVNPKRLEAEAKSSSAEARYQTKDLNDWARFCGLKITRLQLRPGVTGLAMRGAIAAMESGLVEPYSHLVFAACFGDQKDIGQRQVLTEIAIASGLDREQFQQCINDAGTRRRLYDNTQELVDRGGFGCPTMFVGDDMYFGNDRMPLLEMACGRSSGIRFVVPGQHGK